MGMPITIEIVSSDKSAIEAIEQTFAYFTFIDEKFSTYKEGSEITFINKGLIRPEDASPEMKLIFALAAETKRETDGYFDIELPAGRKTPATEHYQGGDVANTVQYEPSGLVKGWAILQAAQLIRDKGFHNFYVDAGGDVQMSGFNTETNTNWHVGIRDPFDKTHQKIVKTVSLGTASLGIVALGEKASKLAGEHIVQNPLMLGIATSGTYIRGQHIFNPKKPDEQIRDIVSLTVIATNVYEADRFATAAFAMGRSGIDFIERLNSRIGNMRSFEAYMIDATGIATMTSGFEKYVLK
jgi:thiamine biosynthesis lipoprotein